LKRKITFPDNVRYRYKVEEESHRHSAKMTAVLKENSLSCCNTTWARAFKFYSTGVW